MDSSLEDYVSHVEVRYEGGKRIAEMWLLRLIEREVIDIDGQEIEELTYHSGESYCGVGSPAFVLTDRNRVFLAKDKLTSARDGILSSLRRHEEPRDEYLAVARNLYLRSLEEDDLSDETYFEEARTHEREHFRYPVDDALVARVAEAGLLGAVPDEDQWNWAIIEGVPFFLFLSEGAQPLRRLAQAVSWLEYKDVQDKHQPSSLLVLDLMCRYIKENTDWIDTSGEELQERVRNFDKLTLDQVREAAGHWHERFYEIREGGS